MGWVGLDNGGGNLGKSEVVTSFEKGRRSGLRGWEEGAEIFLNQQAPFSPGPCPVFALPGSPTPSGGNGVQCGAATAGRAGMYRCTTVPMYRSTAVPPYLPFQVRKSGVPAPAHKSHFKFILVGDPRQPCKPPGCCGSGWAGGVGLACRWCDHPRPPSYPPCTTPPLSANAPDDGMDGTDD